ncbi:vitamin-D-receptor interacting mediator subunit 4-domain-containing protein [Pholiota molesta]|nr:vitamin-D-receptor interacting mediator subunit 4-domain-containing protein [Pholiota molesta]
MSQRFRQTPAPAAPVPSAIVQEDVDSMSAILLAPLNELQALSQTLFLSLSPPQSKPPMPPSFSSILECDKALASAINLAHLHQIKQRKIDALEAEILDLDAQWREICVELSTGKAELEELIEEGDQRIKAIDEAKKASIPYPELLAYAQSLSAFTSAPPNMPDLTLPGQPPHHSFSRLFPMKRRCAVVDLMRKRPLDYWGKHTQLDGRLPSLRKPKQVHTLQAPIHIDKISAHLILSFSTWIWT